MIYLLSQMVDIQGAAQVDFHLVRQHLPIKIRYTKPSNHMNNSIAQLCKNKQLLSHEYVIC